MPLTGMLSCRAMKPLSREATKLHSGWRGGRGGGKPDERFGSQTQMMGIELAHTQPHLYWLALKPKMPMNARHRPLSGNEFWTQAAKLGSDALT